MPMRTLWAAVLALFAVGCGPAGPPPPPADLVLLGGEIVTVDAESRIESALAVRGERIAAVGSDREIRRYVGPDTRVFDLKGKTVIPGLIETHLHPVGVARSEVHQSWEQLNSIPEIQAWIREAAKRTPPGEWIYVPRTDITRLPERRHPLPKELDAGTTKHPVVFVAARKHVLNTLGFEKVGITSASQSIPGVRIVKGLGEKPRLLAGAQSYLRDRLPRAPVEEDRVIPKLLDVLKIYDRVGITSMFDRATDRAGYGIWERLRDEGKLTVRTTVTFRSQFRDGKAVEAYVKKLGVKPGERDPWVKPGPLKIVVDGGIHWGTTHLREAYGLRRSGFYQLDNPSYRGELRFTSAQMADIFATGHRLGWQMSCHVTGDAGIDRVLDALDTANQSTGIRDGRFTLIHAYFPDRSIIERSKALGVCVDTQPFLYYRDSDAMAEVYGKEWAERFIGVGEWRKAGVPVAINSDHMIGLDPDHSMNSFNPFLQMYVAVSRKNEKGKIYGPHQKISRMDALRSMTIDAAYLSFDEKRLGSLEPGKLADFVVLDRDYLACPEEEIRTILAVKTVVGGRVVFDREAR